MIATFVMNGDRIELPIVSGIEKKKIEDRITEKNSVLDGFGSLYDSICLTADIDNQEPILVSDYTEENQVNDWTRADFIELNPGGELHLPWNRMVEALNRPLVQWVEWDVLKVVAR